MRSEIHTESSQVQNNRFKSLILGRVMIISVFVTLFFAILHTLKLNFIGDIQAITNYIHSAFILPTYFLFKQNKISLALSSHIFLVFCYITASSALFSADHDSFRAIWFFISTMIAFIFIGKSYGKVFGYSAMALIAFAGFVCDTNLNTVSVLNSIISLFATILIMSAYTGQMERHLNKIDQIQQELYYFANKSSMSTTLSADKHSLEVEQLMKNAQASHDSFSLIYIDVESLSAQNPTANNSFWNDVRAQLTQKLSLLVSSSDVISQINDHLFYIALPNKDAITLRNLVDKIDAQINHQKMLVNNQSIDANLCISVTTMQAEDSSLRALHVRADQGITKAKAMGGSQIVYVNV